MSFGYVFEKGSRDGLARRMAITFGAAVALFVVAVLAINVQTQRLLLAERETLNVDHLLSLTKEVSTPHLLANDAAALEVFFEELLARDDILSAFLVDASGFVVVGGSYDEIPFLSTIDDPMIDRARETGLRQVQLNESEMAQEVAGPIFVGDQLIGVLRISLCTKTLQQDIQTVFVTNLALGVLFFFVAMIVCNALARRLTEPLSRLTAITQEVAAGDLDQAIDIRADGEIGVLADGLNTMLETVRSSMLEIHRVAYEDKLTGVPNRSWLNNQLEHLALHNTQSETSFAVMFLDLDNFKATNDTHGHHVGDLLLRGFSRRLARCMREQGLTLLDVTRDERHLANFSTNEAVLARLGGDEFTLIVPSDKADALAAHIVSEMAQPFRVEGCHLSNTTSIGIALFPKHATSREHLLKCADVAMYQAKRCGRNTHRYYNHATHTKMKERSALERDLEQAVEQNSFQMHLQPQFQVQSGKLDGAEALIRWDHPTKGSVAPDVFLPVAASIGLLPKIGQLMLAKAIEATASINRDREERLAIAVNVAIEELNDDGFADTVKHWLDIYDADPNTLEIEITENTAMEESVLVERQVAELRAIGVRFAIDDFGMGYSNLGRLKALAFETLKIDRSLITGVGEDPASESLVHTILDMAKAIDADVVAEGIETAEQLAFLRETGCGYYQGYYGGKPMPADDFMRWVARRDDEPRLAS